MYCLLQSIHLSYGRNIAYFNAKELLLSFYMQNKNEVVMSIDLSYHSAHHAMKYQPSDTGQVTPFHCKKIFLLF